MYANNTVEISDIMNVMHKSPERDTRSPMKENKPSRRRTIFEKYGDMNKNKPSLSRIQDSGDLVLGKRSINFDTESKAPICNKKI